MKHKISTIKIKLNISCLGYTLLTSQRGLCFAIDRPFNSQDFEDYQTAYFKAPHSE